MCHVDGSTPPDDVLGCLLGVACLCAKMQFYAQILRPHARFPVSSCRVCGAEPLSRIRTRLDTSIMIRRTRARRDMESPCAVLHATATLLFISFHTAAATCVGWQQTAGCSPKGKRELRFDQSCTAIIRSWASGNCICGERVLTKVKLWCGHPPFSCNTVCARRQQSKTSSSPNANLEHNPHTDAINSTIVNSTIAIEQCGSRPRCCERHPHEPSCLRRSHAGTRSLPSAAAPSLHRPAPRSSPPPPIPRTLARTARDQTGKAHRRKPPNAEGRQRRTIERCGSRPGCCKRNPKELSCWRSVNPVPTLRTGNTATRSLPTRTPASSSPLPLPETLVWAARNRSKPLVCVTSVLSSDLLEPGRYGAAAVEMNANWAVAQGYKYRLFTRRLAPEHLPFVWSGPMAVERMLHEDEGDCEYVLWLDGDAIVNAPSRTVERELIEPFMLPRSDQLSSSSRDGSSSTRDGSPLFLLGCHLPFGDGRLGESCSRCRCLRATEASSWPCRGQDARLRQWHETMCSLNSGVYLVRNTPRSRAMMRSWVLGHIGRKRCDMRKRFLAEQECFSQLWQHSWAAAGLVDVVSARVLNTPSWFDEGLDYAPDPIEAYLRRMARTSDRFTELNSSVEAQTSCLRTGVFVCHAWARSSAVRDVAFRSALEQRRVMLLAMLAARSETYVSISTTRSSPRMDSK